MPNPPKQQNTQPATDPRSSTDVQATPTTTSGTFSRDIHKLLGDQRSHVDLRTDADTPIAARRIK
jgi:hypothetical protein